MAAPGAGEHSTTVEVTHESPPAPVIETPPAGEVIHHEAHEGIVALCEEKINHLETKLQAEIQGVRDDLASGLQGVTTQLVSLEQSLDEKLSSALAPVETALEEVEHVPVTATEELTQNVTPPKPKWSLFGL